MAGDDKPGNGGFIGRVAGDPSNPTPARMLTGWLGDAAESGYRRLYSDPELRSWYDIPEDAILDTEPIRDSQPSGCVFVWVKRDAALKPGGSASSRAGQFLEGPVARDFSSPEKAGLRCVTQPPCGEPTGFTGQCTKQPDLGGGWPCITALPLCSAEPTGFTGKCTHQPWPNPTKYYGCTIFHCPTYDLTHQPWLCNIICGPEPPKPQPGEGDEGESAEAPKGGGEAVTSALGCGYTKTWGLCETHLLGCQPSVQNPCIPPTETPDCGAVPADAGGGGGVNPAITGIACPSAIQQCQTAPPTKLCTPVPQFCPTACGPDCQTPQPNCTSINCTQAGPNCPPHTIGIACTQLPPCPAHEGAEGPAVGPQLTIITLPIWQCAPTPATRCFICPPRTLQWPCPPRTDQPWICPPRTIQWPCPIRTLPPGCPPRTIQCPSAVDACPTRICGGGGIFEAAPGGGGGGGAEAAAYGGYTQYGPQCPTPATMCFICTNVPELCGGAEAAMGGPIGPTGWQGCGGHTAATVCTQFGQQCRSAVDACPTRLCGGGGGGEERAAYGGYTQYGPQCPTPATMCFICTNVPELCGASEAAKGGPIGPTGWQGCGGHTAATVCTQFGQQCRSAVDACPTRLCGGGGGAEAVGGQTAATVCTQYGPQCPTPATMCFICTNVPELCGASEAARGGPIGPTGWQGCGGHTAATVCTQFGQQCRSAVDACPTRLCAEQVGPTGWEGCTMPPQCEGGGGAEAAAAPGLAAPIGPTAWLGCTRLPQACPTLGIACTQFGPQCPTRQLGCTQFGPQCPSPGIACTQFGPQCPTRYYRCTQFGPLCPTAQFQCTRMGCFTVVGPRCIPTE